MESGQAQERVTAVRGAGGQEQIAVLTAGAKALFAAGARRGPPSRRRHTHSGRVTRLLPGRGRTIAPVDPRVSSISRSLNAVRLPAIR